VPALTAPWLVPSPPTGGLLSQRRYALTHVKQLRTTAPKDMKAAKESRIKGKAEAKLRRKILGIIAKKRRKSGASKGKGSSTQRTSVLAKP
jgi:ribonuclease P/MRP protein subunit POP3